MPKPTFVWAALAGSALALILSGCTPGPVGARHIRDEELERRFFQHEAEFNGLLAEVLADPGFEAFMPEYVRYNGRAATVTRSDISNLALLDMPRQRWEGYERELLSLGLAGGIHKGNGRVIFRVESGSGSNGDSEKGYEFTVAPPQHLRPSLNDYGVSDEDRDGRGWTVEKALKEHWYVYLFVNG